MKDKFRWVTCSKYDMKRPKSHHYKFISMLEEIIRLGRVGAALCGHQAEAVVVSKTPVVAMLQCHFMSELFLPHCLRALAADAARKLDVLREDGDALGVDGAQVGVLEETDEVRLRGLLKGENR
jgi:hypothetical protein